MRRNVKSLGMVVFTACILLVAATPAPAQSITCSTSAYSGSAPDGGGGQQPNTVSWGNWTTDDNDTLDTITVYASTDGQTYFPVDGTWNIVGAGTTSGDYSVRYNLPPGNYTIYAQMTTKVGWKYKSAKTNYTVP